MSSRTITLNLPENIYLCLQQAAHKNANGKISDMERKKLNKLRTESNRFMLRKAHAAAILRWRGHQIPPTDKMQETR